MRSITIEINRTYGSEEEFWTKFRKVLREKLGCQVILFGTTAFLSKKKPTDFERIHLEFFGYDNFFQHPPIKRDWKICGEAICSFHIRKDKHSGFIAKIKIQKIRYGCGPEKVIFT